MKKADRDTVIRAGRERLAAWLRHAEAHGTIYYDVPHVARSGMSRHIKLATIVSRKRKPELVALWPTVPNWERFAGAEYSAALDVVAKDWGFSFQDGKRCFVIAGCGMDMVFALVDDLAAKGGMDRGYANRVRRESF